MTKKVIYISISVINIILLVSLFLFFQNKNHANNKIIKILEYQIDSIKNEIHNSNRIIISLNNRIISNDDTIKILLNDIGLLELEKIKIKNKYENRNKQIQQMSNDSIVIQLRQYIYLWSKK